MSSALKTFIIAVFLCVPLFSARAEYVAQRGDTLNLAVLSAPALNRLMVVDSKGNITVPLLGDLKAAEVPLSELSLQIQTMLAAKNIVQSANVILSVSEYCPIYVDGDVARPSEYKYQPEMTVRSAISLAGGIDSSGGLRRLTPAQLSEARGDYSAAAIELAKEDAHATRLKAELAGAETFDASLVQTSADVEGTVLKEIVAIEAQQMDAEREARVHQEANLKQTLAASVNEVSELEKAEVEQTASFDMVAKTSERARDLLQRGLGTAERIEDTQRSFIQAQSQIIDIRVQLARARKEVADRSLTLDTYRDQYRSKTLEALKDAVSEAGKAQSRMTAARERMAGRGNAFLTTEAIVDPQITVRRLVNGATVRIAAQLDTVLISGDNIEVRVAGAATSQ